MLYQQALNFIKGDGDAFPHVVIRGGVPYVLCGVAVRLYAVHDGNAAGTINVKSRGDKGYGGIGEMLIQYLSGEFEILPGAGGLVFHGDADGIYTIGDQVVLHGLSFAEVFAVSFSAGYDNVGIRAVPKVFKGGVKAVFKGQGDSVAPHRAAKDDQHIFIVLCLFCGGRGKYAAHHCEKYDCHRINYYEYGFYPSAYWRLKQGKKEAFEYAGNKHGQPHYGGQYRAKVAVAYHGKKHRIQHQQRACGNEENMHPCYFLSAQTIPN